MLAIWMKKLLLIIFCIVLFRMTVMGVEQPVYTEFFTDEACRIDFYLEGNHQSQKAVFHKVTKIRYWGGSKTILIDPMNYGSYRVQLFNVTTGKLIFQKGFATLFEEWQTTKLAKDQEVSFEESVIFPNPKVPVNISIQRRNPDNSFSVMLEKNLLPGQALLSLELDTLKRKYVINNGPSHKKVDIVFLPDGYQQKDKSKFYKDVKKYAKKLLKTEAFKKHKKDFNVVVVEAWSEDRGVDFPQYEQYKNTRFDCTFNTFGSERYLMTYSYWKVLDVASLVAFDQVVLLANSAEYGGGGIYNHYATFTSDHKMSDFVLSHEFGHSFAGLADEYVGNTNFEEKLSLDVEPWQPNITTLQDFKSKWADMLDENTPIPTPVDVFDKAKLGVYEGAAYAEKGVYRPMYNCSMRAALRDQFCPVCIRAMQKMIEIQTY
jgi:hypothetical protein